MLIFLTSLFATLNNTVLDLPFPCCPGLENLALRHHSGVLQRSARKRPKLTSGDRLLWICLSRLWRDWRSALAIVKPETVVTWHRAGFRLFWTWKVRHGQPGRPLISREARDPIRKMCQDNPAWGAPRIHGELLKLGIDIGESSVSKYMVRSRKPPSQTWRTFLENHAKQLVSIDFFTVPTIRFQVLYVFLVLAHDRRRILLQCDRSPNRGVDGTATAGGISLCPTPALPVAAGPRCHLWQSFPRTGARYGHLRSSVCATLTLAESLCGTSDWIDSTRVPRSCDRIPGKLATANLQFVFRLLSPIENASFVGEGLPRATSDSAAGSGVRRGGTADWWANSLLRLCLQF